MEDEDIYTKMPSSEKPESVSVGKKLIEAAISQEYGNKSNLSKEIYTEYSSKNSSNKSNSNAQSDTNLSSTTSKLDDMQGIIFCDKCKGPYCINIMDNLDLSIDCGCFLIKNLTIEEYMNDYKLKRKNEQYCVHCLYHKNEKKLIYYCIDCEYDLCVECLKEYSIQFGNKKTKYKSHENHSLIILDDIMEKFGNIKKSIEQCNTIIEGKNYNKIHKKKIINIILVIEILIELYPHNKCFNFFQSILNSEKLLEKIKNNYNFSNHENLIDFKKITTENNLCKINDFPGTIGIIKIKNSKIPIDLSIFKNIEFPCLKELILTNDGINDISPLSSCKFPVLEKLNLEKNNIDDNIIVFLKKINLPKLTYLNLFVNKITNLEIFEIIKKFENLKQFHIGDNKFDFNRNSKSFYEFPKSLELLGITGDFDGENAFFIEKLGIENLKTFYFSRNNISSLKYLKNIQFNKIESFWAISNNITDIKEIMNINGKETLKIINLKENKLNNFDELFDIINNFPKLEKIILNNNNISEEEANEMKKRIKDKYKKDLDIVTTNLYYNIYKV